MDREAARGLAVTLGLLMALGGERSPALVLALGVGGSEPVDLEIEEISREARSDSTLRRATPWPGPRRARESLRERATLGTSHVIYEKSPGGVVASVERTLSWRREIEAAARPAGVDPDTLEAIVFLESAGRPQVMADGTPNSASGLTQIIPSTATSFLGMQVDLARSVELTNQINERREGQGQARSTACSRSARASTSASTPSLRLKARRATSRSPPTASARKSSRSSRTTWESATSRT